MVSTRGFRYKFNIGERVLCYEPDPTKAKVLYDSKVLDIIESKDKRGRKIVEYLIHFQGWNSSWDRHVVEEFVLKDTAENRQLQKDLAEKSQLQLGAYLYRKDRNKRSRIASINDRDSRTRRSSEEGSSCSTGGRDEEFIMLDMDTESYSSSVESTADEERVVLQVGEKLKQYLEFDYNMITKKSKLVLLPAKVSIITILENYVKYCSIKSICCPGNSDNSRRRNSLTKIEKREKDFEKIANNIELRKEVADGLRLYFDFTLKDYLLYPQEKIQANHLLSEAFLSKFTYVPTEKQTLDAYSFPYDTPNTPFGSEVSESHWSSSEIPDESNRRRLRSFKHEDNDVFDFDRKHDMNGISSVASTSSGSSTPKATTMTSASSLRSMLQLNTGVGIKVNEIMQNLVNWQLLPAQSQTSPSMIYGGVHLARLIVKLPQFLNASNFSDDRLQILLKHLDSFVEFIEHHKEWFTENCYMDSMKLEKTEMSD